MPTLSVKEKKELCAQGASLKPCVTIREGVVNPILIENIMCFLARTPLVRIGLPALSVAERKKLVNAIADSTHSVVLELVAGSALLYRTANFAR